MIRKACSLLLVAFFSLTLVGCADNPPENEDNSIWAENLFANRNSYIGDNVADNDLLLVLAVSENIGEYTLALQTEDEPYGLTIRFACEDPHNELMEKYAYILLALIDNVEIISWTFNDGTAYTVDVAAADALLPQDIKSYGKSMRTVELLLIDLGF